MKKTKFYLFFLTLLSINTLNAQSLNFNDIKYIYLNDVEKSEDYISKKGFEFYLSEKEKNGFDSFTNWACKRNNFDNKSKAFVIKSCFKPKCGFVWYQFHDIRIYNAIKGYCKKNGFKLINTTTDETGFINHTFTDLKFRIKFSSGLNSEGFNEYFITLDYK